MSNELGAFIRTLREGVSPGDVGLPAASRRRTPGLRRSELAMLADISVEYLTRLEQGRDRHPSAQVVGSLAEALGLSPADRSHLRLMWKSAGGGDVICAPDAPASEIRPTVRALLDRLGTTPAVLLNRLSDIVTFTRGYELLAAPLGIIDEPAPNLLRYVFTDPRARDAFPEWDRVADHEVVRFRTAAPPDEHSTELSDDLTVIAGAAFHDRMSAATTVATRTGVERWRHPEVGELRLAFESLDLPDDALLQLVVLLPADDASAAALDQLAGRRPGTLHAVSG